MNNNDFAERMRYYRQMVNMRQEDLAKRMGVSQKTVSSWETGRTDPNMGQVINLCHIFDCSIHDLTGTRERRTGEVGVDDVLVRINTMSESELDAVYQAVSTRRKYLKDAARIMAEKEKIERQMLEMKKRLEELENEIIHPNSGTVGVN